jgi:predicted nucleic acid-binding protein
LPPRRIRTFLDSGVLITAARSSGAGQELALAILESSNRIFLATPFLALEVIPKAAYNRHHLELRFYQRYIAAATTYRGLNRIEKIAGMEAARCGLAAMDALHVAAAYLLKADELVTTEKPGKPMYRTTLVKVRWLYG